jgi:hypothetical protein
MNTNLIPTQSMNPSRIASLAGHSLRILAAIFGLGLILYIVLVAWLHHHLASQAISISQAAGAPADAERILKGFLSWLLSFAVVPAIVRLAAESLNPFRSNSTVIARIALIMAIGISAALLPHGLRSLRGVDAQGLPRVMRPSDPVAAQWFDPDGKATLFWSKEHDGTLRFWSRPGVTPDSGVASVAVTPAFRMEWEARRKQLEHADQEQSRLERDKMRIEQAEREREKMRIEQAERERLAQDAERQRQREEQIRREQQAVAKAERDAAIIRVQAEMARIEGELRVSREAERAAVIKATRAEQERIQAAKRQPAERRDSKTASVPQPKEAPWLTRRMLPGKYFEFNSSAPFLEIKTGNYLEVERPGGIWTRVSPGTITLNNQAHSMRFHCRTAFQYDIQIRPF